MSDQLCSPSDFVDAACGEFVKRNANLTNPRMNLSSLVRNGLENNTAPMWEHGRRTVSRHEAREMVGRAQRCLRGAGLLQGQRLVLHGAPSPETLSVLLACLADGIVVIPIDDSLPEIRKSQMLELSVPHAVMDFSGKLRVPKNTPLLSPVAPYSPHDVAGLMAAKTSIHDEAPCYIFFTSGTTGIPKPVLGRGSGLAHFIQWEVDMLKLTSSDRVSMLTRFSFDVVLRDILLPLSSGATSVIPEEESPMSAGGIMSWVHRHGITVIHTVPSIGQAILTAQCDVDETVHMRHTLFAGEPLSDRLVNRWRKRFPKAEVHNLYGPTETTLAKFHARVPLPALPGIQSCGHPLPGTKVKILDEAGDPAPIGVLGQVVVHTPFASLGYFRADGAVHPIMSMIGGQDYYRTGDLGFLDEQGELHLRGRADDQVKILGVRLELAGIAAVIEACKGVEKAVVVALDGEGAQKYLVGYYSASSDTEITSAEIRAHMAARLPAAGIPRILVRCDEMPVTLNGKIDKNRLPNPSRDVDAYVIPAEGLETAIAAAFSDELGGRKVGATDDFFALGGDSLAATAVCVRLMEEVYQHIEPGMFLDAPTPRELALFLQGQGNVRVEPIPRAPDEVFFPLSPQQQRYFRTFCSGGNRSWCNMVALFDLPDGVNAFDVTQAIEDIALHHDSLRLSFEYGSDGSVVQCINPTTDFALGVLDLGDVPENEIEVILADLKTSEGEVQIPIFSSSACFRAMLLFLPEGRRKLLWTVHHLVSDGTSQGIYSGLLAEWLSDKVGFRRKYAELHSIRDVVFFARRLVEATPGRAFLTKLLTKPNPYEHQYLPQPKSVKDPQRALAFERTLRPETAEGIRDRASALKCTPYVILLAGYFRLLEKLTGLNDQCIVTPLAGRQHPVIAKMIGDFINLVPLRVPGLGAISNRDLILTLRQQVAETMRSQDFQFDALVDALELTFTPDRNPITGFSLNYMPQGGKGPIRSGGHEDRGYKLKYDMLFLVRDFYNVLNVEIQCRAGIFDRNEIETVMDRFEDLLKGLAHD